MSGHSKWAKIHRQKAASDAKKSAVFGKISKQITLAARKDPNPETNFSLRLLFDKAKAVNMPKENVDRAIEKATSKAENLEEIMYEGYAPHGIAVIIQAATDNKNRLNQEIKAIFNKSNGKIGEPGSVAWMFELKGVITIHEPDKDKKDALMLEAIDSGASDVKEQNEHLIIYTAPNDLKKVKDELEKSNSNIEDASLDYIAQNKIELDQEKKQQVEEFLDQIEENEDVSSYYSNLKN